MHNVPIPFNPTEKYLAAILEELERLNRHLANQSPQGDEQSGVVELREPLGDPADHPAAKPSASGEINTGIVMQSRFPDSFPGATHLREEGISHYDAIPRDEKSLTAIPGIGKATAAAIIAALDE